MRQIYIYFWEPDNYVEKTENQNVANKERSETATRGLPKRNVFLKIAVLKLFR